MTEGSRIGDAERDRAAADLSEHVALGRLTVDEHGGGPGGGPGGGRCPSRRSPCCWWG